MPDARETLQHRVSRELLPHVTQPAQYIGGEINQLAAEGDWDNAQVRVAIAFPDAYTIGMSHLGCQILYWLCNHTPGVCAERVYAPWTDAERVMRSERIELFTWDTRRPVRQADILAVSLQYELTFTNLLTLLDLAGIPLRSSRRDDSHPLVIVGGPQADNPEPVAPFVDLVVIGDGEDSMAAILDAYNELKSGGVRRRDMISRMAERFPWIYAPALWEPEYGDDGTIARFGLRGGGAANPIERCRTLDFENAPFPVRPLVPHIPTVHDRMAIEIMRGCPQRCRFCHAGYTKRPLKLRSVEKIVAIAEQQYAATGQDEIGLLSLSTSDYPHIRALSERLNERFAERGVNISMPSLRVDRMLRDIPSMASSVRKSGLTVAIEAARDTMRSAIRKKVTDGDLADGILEAYKAGWRRVKCYFMVGFPGETEDDIRGIHDLAVEVANLRRRLGKGPAQVNASVGWLVPKPFTPFQWAAQRRTEYFEQARRTLREVAEQNRCRSVRIKMHDPTTSVLEGVLARGDRRLADVIERAYRLGARFDGWTEKFRPDIWRQAFDETGVDPDGYAHRERSFDEVLPWDHIRSGPSREVLKREYLGVFETVGRLRPVPGVLPILASHSPC